jgi:hypothetical protein
MPPFDASYWHIEFGRKVDRASQSVVNFILSGFTAAFLHRVFRNLDRRAAGPRLDLVLEVPA